MTNRDDRLRSLHRDAACGDDMTMQEFLDANGIELDDPSHEDMIALSGLGVYKSVQQPGEHDGEIAPELLYELRTLRYPRKLRYRVSAQPD